MGLTEKMEATSRIWGPWYGVILTDLFLLWKDADDGLLCARWWGERRPEFWTGKSTLKPTSLVMLVDRQGVGARDRARGRRVGVEGVGFWVGEVAG